MYKVEELLLAKNSFYQKFQYSKGSSNVSVGIQWINQPNLGHFLPKRYLGRFLFEYASGGLACWNYNFSLPTLYFSASLF